MTGRVFGEVVSWTRSGVHAGVIDSGGLGRLVQQAHAMARQRKVTKMTFSYSLMQFELSRRKDTAEKLFLIYEYVGNGS